MFQEHKDFTKNNWKGKNVLLFGSEGYGIKAKTLENSDFKFKVNMNNNIESLNISNTVSVVCHHIFQSINKIINLIFIVFLVNLF